MEKPTRLPRWAAWLLLLAAFWGLTSWWAARELLTVPYSEFDRLMREGAFARVRVHAQMLEGELRQPLPDGHRRVAAVRVPPDMARDWMDRGVAVEGVVDTGLWRDIAGWVLPVLLMVGLWTWALRRAAGLGGEAGPGPRTGRRSADGLGGLGGWGGLLSVGRSRARLVSEADVSVRFDDVAGVDEAKAELQESVAFLRDPKSYGRLGARMPKGILLVGPPGTGKTLLARAVAGEARVPFFSITGSEFVELFVGVGAARVRDLFDQARESAPCIVFIDELDALGRARGAGPAWGGHDEKEQTLNQLLAEMDGFDTRAGVVILAATNRPEILDPALLRAGRFDRQVLVDKPDRKGRVDILKVHLRRVVAAPALDLEAVAALTPGFAGADLANLVNEAALHATRRGAAAVEMDDFTAAVERVVAGLERHTGLLGERERRAVAVHEMGHCLVALSLPGADAVHKVSIIPRGVGALGYTLQRPSEDRHLALRAELEDRLVLLMGGRAAEWLLLGQTSTGAADDLVKATDLAHDMVARFGMSDGVGPVAWDRPLSPPFGGLTLGMGVDMARGHSEDTARRLDRAVRALLESAGRRAFELLRERRALLEQGVAQLLAHETLTREDLAPYAAAAAAGATPPSGITPPSPPPP